MSKSSAMEIIEHEMKEVLVETRTEEEERKNYKIFYGYGSQYINVKIANLRIMEYFELDIPVLEFLELRESNCLMAIIRDGIKKVIEAGKRSLIK